MVLKGLFCKPKGDITVSLASSSIFWRQVKSHTSDLLKEARLPESQINSSYDNHVNTI